MSYLVHLNNMIMIFLYYIKRKQQIVWQGLHLAANHFTPINFNKLNNRIELQDKRTLLHHNSISAAVNTIQLASRWVCDNKSGKSKLKKNIDNFIEDIRKWKQKADNNNSNSWVIIFVHNFPTINYSEQ